MNTYADYFAGNVVTGDSSRSAKDLSFAIFLVRKGLTAEEICVILENAEYNKGKELKEKYLERTIAKAMETVQDRDAQVAIGVADTSMRLEHDSKSPNSNIGTPVLLRYSEIKHHVYPTVERFRTGIRHLDTYTDGGLGIGELSLFVAEKATGKSTLACWIGAHAVQQGYNVLHVFYEDRQGSLKQRYDSHIANTDFDSDVYFYDGTEKPVRIPQIERAIQQCNPGLVIIDYLARLPEAVDDRFSIRDVIFKFGNLARTYNTHILVADHVTVERPLKDKQGQPVPESYVMEDYRLSEAKMYKSMAVDIMIGMMKDRVDHRRVWLTGMKFKMKDTQMKGVSMSVDWGTGKYVG